VHVIGHQMAFLDATLLLFGQRSEHQPEMRTQLTVQCLAPELILRSAQTQRSRRQLRAGTRTGTSRHVERQSAERLAYSKGLAERDGSRYKRREYLHGAGRSRGFGPL
jgi:hypothetical protein